MGDPCNNGGTCTDGIAGYTCSCPLGFIGKLFVTSELPDFIQYLSVFYNEWPCDWLLMSYTRTRACPINAGKVSNNQCCQLNVGFSLSKKSFNFQIWQHCNDILEHQFNNLNND